MLERLSTQFAPAERIDPQQIAREAPDVQAALELQTLLDAVPNVLLVLNRFRQVIYTNQALLDMLEIDDPSQIYGLRPGEVLQCDHAFAEAGGCGTSEACSTCGAAQAILMGLRGKAAIRECRITTQSGTALDLRVWARPLIVKGQMCTIFAITDISDEKRRYILERLFLHDIHNSAALVVSHVQLQVFRRSYSTKGEGRGLGTYSIKLLSESYLQGKVWFESSAGEGTRFFARYPLQIRTS